MGFKLSLMAVPATIPKVRRKIGSLLADSAIDDDRRREIMLAVSEACTNVVMHAYRDQPGELAVGATLLDRMVFVEVRDAGVGIRPRMDSPGVGVGLPLILTLADWVRLTHEDDGGTRLTMRFDERH